LTPRLEVADVFRQHKQEFLSRWGDSLSPQQRKAFRDICACRTAALGARWEQCDHCARQFLFFHSCRNRACPKCQARARDQWLDRTARELLPVPYSHVTFTLPHQLSLLALENPRTLYNILFRAVSETLLTIAADPHRLGAQLGFLAVLHTWGQNLQFHPHVHCVVTGGGLGPDGATWIHARDRFFLPVKVMGRLFRGKFLHALRAAYRQGKLHGRAAAPLNRSGWKRLRDQLYRRDWIVYAKPPFGGPDHVFRYLGRYTHRVAISNHRLLAIDDGHVTFAVRDYADEGKKKQLTVSSGEFIRRFLLHVLPHGFTRIRHYGLLAPRNVRGRLARAHELLAPKATIPMSQAEAVVAVPATWWQRMLRLTGIDVMLCPYCRAGRLVREDGGLPARAPP
jgi:hypothetical protein